MKHRHGEGKDSPAGFGDVIVTADELIVGLSDAFECMPNASPQERLQVLMETAAVQGVGAPAPRGPDVFRNILDVLLRRRAKKEVGPFEVPTRWVSFHVPPGGKGHLKIANRTGSEYGLKLKAVGSGWGSGRGMTLSVSRDFQERTACFQVALALKTRVTLFEDDAPPRADVLGVAGLIVEELGECPDCSGENERHGADVVPAGEWIDLRRDSKGQTVETSLEMVDKFDVNLSVPFTVPGLNVQIGIDWSRRSQLSCNSKYILPGGRRYRPSTSREEPQDLPYWRWE